jgi:hypothetical protein
MINGNHRMCIPHKEVAVQLSVCSTRDTVQRGVERDRTRYHQSRSFHPLSPLAFQFVLFSPIPPVADQTASTATATATSSRGQPPARPPSAPRREEDTRRCHHCTSSSGRRRFRAARGGRDGRRRKCRPERGQGRRSPGRRRELRAAPRDGEDLLDYASTSRLFRNCAVSRLLPRDCEP